MDHYINAALFTAIGHKNGILIMLGRMRTISHRISLLVFALL